MARWACLAALVAGVVILLVCLPAGSGQTNEEELWRHRHIGKALFETPARMAEAPAELKKALDLAPKSFRDRLNYGIALLRAGDPANAITQLETAQKQNPAVPHTWFNLGIAYKHARRNADAIRQFQRMTEIVPDEPVSHYNLGMLFALEDRWTQALEQFRVAADLDSTFVAPRFQIHTYYRLNGTEAEADRALADFQAAKKRQQSSGKEEDVEWSIYAELYDPIAARPAARDATPPPPLRFDDRGLAGSLDPRTAGLLVLDAAGNGHPGLLAWSRTGAILYPTQAARPIDLGATGVIDIAAGDYDNDGLQDLCVIGADGARILQNRNGRFEDSGIRLPSGRFRKALWLDSDHDYDLDLFLFGDSSVLLRNQGNGAFEDYTSHFPFVPGRPLDAVELATIPDGRGVDVAVSFLDRKGVLYRDQLRGEFQAEPLEAVPAGAARLRAIDVNNDSWIDLAFSTLQGVSLALSRQAKFNSVTTGAAGAYTFADLENRGFADLVAANGLFRNRGLAQFGKAAKPAGVSAFAALAQADFDGDGRADIAAVAPDGGIHLLLNRTTTKNGWLRVALTGVKNLKAAAGSMVEIGAGDHYQKGTYGGMPLLFGLGPRTKADVVRVTWPNGMIQSQTEEAAGRTVPVKEAPRLAGSCPMIFTWNGRGFQFISDVLGVAPLGASASDGVTFPVDHDEYVSIPAEALAPIEGQYEIRVTEELHEVTYLDQAQLMALDHPRDIEVFTNEKFKSPPFPEFRLFGCRRRIHPLAAHDGNGRNVLAGVLRQNRVYTSGFAHDSAGSAEMHTLTLDFGPAAAPRNSAVLLLHGWVDWADGSTFLNASQRPGGGLVFPYLQVKDAAGEWRTVVEDMGIPSGKPKTIAVDLSGKFLSPSREIRIVTNLCVYWDEIFLSENASAPKARLTILDTARARLRLRGFSGTVIDPRREQPEAFEYATWTSNASWNQTAGLYTRYGDVRELVLAPDDRFVIMGSGDELQLRFPATSLPPVPPEWRRDFLLLIDGWAKDSDANTAYSQTVDPLPFHAMSGYPYPASEHYPDDDAHRAYRAAYNTRPAIRFVPRLLPGPETAITSR
jgi:hypothetical protein